MTTVSGRQSLGAREGQEDSFRILRQSDDDPGSDMLILLADGMGGHVGGEIASKLVVEQFERHCITVSRNPKPVQRMVEAMEAANSALRDRIAREPELAGMGSTLVAALKLGSKLIWLSIGDSPMWLWREGAMRRLNADHSVHGELMALVRDGRLTQQEADSNPRRNALRSALIGERISLVDTGSVTLQTGDLILAASDGIETLDEPRIAAILGQPDRKEPRHLTADLLNAVDAMAGPRQDNTTVIVYRHDPAAGIARTTDSLFAVAAVATSPIPPRWPVWATAAGAALTVALCILIYVIGWGGDPAEPEAQAPPAPEVAAPPSTGAPGAMPGPVTGSPVEPAVPQPGLPADTEPENVPARAPITLLPAPAPVPAPSQAVPGVTIAPPANKGGDVDTDSGIVPSAPVPAAPPAVPSAATPQQDGAADETTRVLAPEEIPQPTAKPDPTISSLPPRPRPFETAPDVKAGSDGRED